MMLPSPLIPLNVTLTLPAPTVKRLLARVTVAEVSLPSMINTPAPGSAVGASGAGTFVVVVVVVEDELDDDTGRESVIGEVVDVVDAVDFGIVATEA